ncbi:MAG: hypothetical protein HY509_03180 [Acidobacteria bacterium]|nr:hypothetical protein [Acidobacteriota bacterium]
MNRARTCIGAAAFAGIAALLSGCIPAPGETKPRTTLFVGVDASGSFQRSGHYDDSLVFLAHYLYGRMNGLGGLQPPRELFVAAVGGNDPGEPKSFHPIHDFTGKGIEELEQDLREWFPPQDSLTDFNPFFREVARIARERNLVLAPITVLIVTDGIPDVTLARADSRGDKTPWEKINLDPLEYLTRNLTLRLAYVSPAAGRDWRLLVPRNRVRLWTVDADVMRGWREQLEPGASLANQNRLWKWVRDNLDYRVRSFGF